MPPNKKCPVRPRVLESDASNPSPEPANVCPAIFWEREDGENKNQRTFKNEKKSEKKLGKKIQFLAIHKNSSFNIDAMMSKKT